ncbi:MAG: outer membrane lipoprotein-sorting protein [Patescibacteria group bacterium]
MKKVLIIIVFLVLMVLVFALMGRAQEKDKMSAKEIVETSYHLYRQGVKTEKEKMDLDIMHGESQTEKKQLVKWTQYEEKRKDKVFIEFTSPNIDKGLKLLVHRQENEDMIWMKLPSLSRDRRISGQDEGNYFAETDLTYRDTAQLAGEATEEYNYHFVETDDPLSDGPNVKWTIKAEPKEDTDAIYGHRIFFVTKDFVIAGIKYFDSNGDIIKVQVNKKIVQDKNGRWRTDKIIIENRYYNRTTEIEVTKRDYNNDQAPSFSRRDLRR